MRGVVLPGVFRPRSDTWLLARTACAQPLPGNASVLELCAGPAFAGIAVARKAVARLTTVDVSRRARINALLNAKFNGVELDAHRGNLFEPLGGRRFDLILANPPYVPGPPPPTRGAARATDAGDDGRAILDRICAEAPAHLHAGGTLLIVHSEVCAADRTLAAFEERGLAADVVARERGPLGPILRARRGELERRGQLALGQVTEEVLVLRARLVGKTSARWPIPTP